jgi:hypothetical protein
MDLFAESGAGEYSKTSKIPEAAVIIKQRDIRPPRPNVYVNLAEDSGTRAGCK